MFDIPKLKKRLKQVIRIDMAISRNKELFNIVGSELAIFKIESSFDLYFDSSTEDKRINIDSDNVSGISFEIAFDKFYISNATAAGEIEILIFE